MSKLSKKMQEALNEQINLELYSSYVYLSMAAYFEDCSLEGFARWMGEQAKEETGHAMKIYGYINARQGRVTLKAIDAPPAEWESPMAAFQDALEHEKRVTKSICDLVEKAKAENDPATGIFLQWFVSEQVEEEATVSSIVDKMALTADFKGGIFMMNKELGSRGA